ncbi:peroxiredoxin [Alteromonas pelagimontana]|uniref:Glutathione-dependent peroxiredoxin n=1 Tax=Alteromonas pelagimontana TaxID=1858656 RepID=A0A6M4MDI1_9ALTE|nr:peroxiredoxin [Alteromonas pelagimontana]QJR81149.1 peroxiredoxin [Alteromonas pelagimontana]
MITVGATLPEVTFNVLVNGELTNPRSHHLFADKKVVLFAVPGAFTPTCSAAHLPGYVALADKLKAKGVDEIMCVAVNDAFVMDAWKKSANAEEITMLADGNAYFTKAIGLDMNTGDFGGFRSVRYSMLVINGVVRKLNIEDPGRFVVSDAQTMLDSL